MKKYRLGGYPEEYELKEDYLEWLPEGYEDWEQLFLESIKKTKFTLVNPESEVKKTIFLHKFVIKDAFPMSFHSEERSVQWRVFAIVSKTETSKKFIIPLY